MVGRNYVTRGSSDSSKSITRAWRTVTNTPLDETPGGFDGIEIMRIGRQALQGGPALLDEEANLGSLVRLQIVQQHNVASAQSRGEPTPHPGDKGGCVHRLPLRAQHDPAPAANGADEREVVAPVHRAR